MKTFIAFIALLIAVKANAQKLLRTDSVYISGKIKNFNAVKDRDNPVNVWVNELALGKQITYRGRIFDDGTYSISFLKTGAQEVDMNVSNKGIYLLVSPGDHLVINFDALQPSDSVEFNGDDAQTNRDYRAYQLALTTDTGINWQARYKALDKSETSHGVDTHIQFLKDRYHKEGTFLNQYLKKHKVTPTFASWAKAELKYEYLANLMRYPWLHRENGYNQQFSVPDSYYGFIKEADLNDLSATISSKYGDYMSEYINRFNKKNLAAVHNRSEWMDLYLKEPTGIKRDVMLSRFIYQLLDAYQLLNAEYVEQKIKPIIDKYKAGVGQPAVKNSVLKVYDSKTYQLTNYTLPINARINTRPQTGADSVFNKILAKYPGKVVYVDFWSTQCGPCRQEMSSSNILYKQLVGKDVVFLYLAVRSYEELWKASIAEMGIEGEHFLLNNNDDIIALQAKFQFISGTQYYILVDKKGKIVDNNAKRPGDSRIKAEIEKLIAVK